MHTKEVYFQSYVGVYIDMLWTMTCIANAAQASMYVINQICNKSSHFWFKSSHLIQIFSRVESLESLYKFQWVESLKTIRVIHLFKNRVTSHHSLQVCY